MSIPRYFVTGTDTGVGKTEVSAALLSLMADAGLNPAPFKPYESGCKVLSRPADALRLQAAARSDDALERISLHRFKAPVAPGVAAARLRQSPSFGKTLAGFHHFDHRALVVEGAGGLLVPLDATHDVIDLIEALALPVVLVARAGLGTLNHTGLSLRELQRRNLTVAAVVLSRASATPDASLADNADRLRQRYPVRVLGPVPFTRDPGRRRAAFRRALAPLL